MLSTSLLFGKLFGKQEENNTQKVEELVEKGDNPEVVEAGKEWLETYCDEHKIEDPMRYYCDAIAKYNHGFYVSGTNLPYGHSRYTHLSYQTINTLAFDDEQFERIMEGHAKFIKEPIEFLKNWDELENDEVIKEAINKSITKSQIAINDMKEKVSEIKSEMKAKAKSIVDEIKLKGKAALNRVAEFTRLTSKLAYVREGIREGIKETDKTIERINGFGHGMRNAGRQIVNSFRVLAGHEEKESSEDKKMYITGILRSPWVGQKKVYEGMERVLNGAIDRLENLSKEMTEEKEKVSEASYGEFENEKTESMEMVGPEWEMEVAEEEKFYGDEFFQPEEEIEFIDLDDVSEKKMVAEGKSR